MKRASGRGARLSSSGRQVIAHVSRKTFSLSRASPMASRQTTRISRSVIIALKVVAARQGGLGKAVVAVVAVVACVLFFTRAFRSLLYLNFFSRHFLQPVLCIPFGSLNESRIGCPEDETHLISPKFQLTLLETFLTLFFNRCDGVYN